MMLGYRWLFLFFFGGEPLSIWVMLQQLYRGRAPCAGSQADLIFSASNTLCRTPAEIEPSGRKSGKRELRVFCFYFLFFGFHSIFSRQQITMIATKTSCCCLGRISDDPPSAFLTLRDRHRYARQIAGLPPPPASFLQIRFPLLPARAQHRETSVSCSEGGPDPG